MTWQDIINGLYELLAGAFVANHARVLYRDKKVRGVSATSTAFFFSWGVWNLYYYPHLDQWMSFFGGLSIATANCVWLWMMLYYIHRERNEWNNEGSPEDKAKQHWLDHGPCAPQCNAECEGTCLNELRQMEK